MSDFSVIKGRQREMWGAGDYAAVATPLLIVSELLCEAVDLRAGSKVLDVATGSGNTALAAARRRCEVIGLDYVPALLERARERAAVERLDIRFEEGDAESLPYPDETFDVVLSTFGVMFAPDQAKAASELLRVCRPGGRIGLANWTPGGFVGQWFQLTARYVPPPPGMEPPLVWGTEDGLRTFVPDAHDMKIESLDAMRQESFASELVALAQRFNRSGDDTIVVPAEYAEVVCINARRRL